MTKSVADGFGPESTILVRAARFKDRKIHTTTSYPEDGPRYPQ